MCYCTFIRPMLDYAAPVRHPTLTGEQSDDLEQVQIRATPAQFITGYSIYTVPNHFVTWCKLQGSCSSHRPPETRGELSWAWMLRRVSPAAKGSAVGCHLRKDSSIRKASVITTNWACFPHELNDFDRSPIANLVHVLNDTEDPTPNHLVSTLSNAAIYKSFIIIKYRYWTGSLLWNL